MDDLNRLCPRRIHTGLAACWLAFMATFAMGCHHERVEVSNPIEIDRAEFTRIYDAALKILGDYGFRIDRHSHRLGTIATKYLASPTVFESWHTTNSTDRQSWESTLNHQRRRVIVSLEPAKPATGPNEQTLPSSVRTDQYRLHVEVFVERRQHPDRHLTGSTTGHGVYGTLTTTPGEWRERGIEGSYWRPLGRDVLLEQRLLADIIRKSIAMEPTQS